MQNLVSVSIIIPCRNEEKYISQCLDSIINNDYPKNKIEILVIDGMSEDKTREILKKYTERYSFIKVLDNPKKVTPVALNIGIKKAKGEIIIRMDSHAIYKEDYISKCIKYLKKYNADNVGGIWVICPQENTLIAKSIAFALSHILGTGDAYYKIGSKKLMWTDTVPFGCYKKEIFKKIGLFNENLIRSQDMEFNLRLKDSGGKILLIPEIVGYYYPKPYLREFFIKNFIDGIWAIYPLKFVKRPLRLRHYIPFIFVTSLIGLLFLSFFFSFFFSFFLFILGLYFLVNICFSFQIASREKDFRYFFIMPIIFAVRHFAYGFGSIVGLVRVIVFKLTNLVKNIVTQIRLS